MKDKIELYRPKGVTFLDETNPLAFWKSKTGAKADFPDATIKGYTEKEIEEYCQRLRINPRDLVAYH